MTNQEYIELHPEKFTDDIDKWLFTEFSILGGCCSAQGSMEYSVARMVAEKLFKAEETADKAYFESCEKVRKQTIDKACEAFCKIVCYGDPPRSTCKSLGTCRSYDDFYKAMEE